MDGGRGGFGGVVLRWAGTCGCGRARGVEGESADVRDALQACRRFDRRGAYMSCAVYQSYEKMSAGIFLSATSLAILKLNVCMRPKNIHENARGFIQFQEVLPSRVKS